MTESDPSSFGNRIPISCGGSPDGTDMGMIWYTRNALIFVPSGHGFRLLYTSTTANVASSVSPLAIRGIGGITGGFNTTGAVTISTGDSNGFTTPGDLSLLAGLTALIGIQGLSMAVVIYQTVNFHHFDGSVAYVEPCAEDAFL